MFSVFHLSAFLPFPAFVLMELDFDKEIDALIRREGAARTITIGEFAGLHPDADEIAAFVENAVPAGSRREMVDHFAACDPCRRILSTAIMINAESAPAASDGVVAPVEATVLPWYRRLFLFPNLAYVMGGLIVLFGGFMGLSVLNSYQDNASQVSQVHTGEIPAPVVPDQGASGNANMTSVAANASNSLAVANTASSPAMTNSAAAPLSANTSANAAPVRNQNFAIDGVDSEAQPKALAQVPVKNEPKPTDNKLTELADKDRKAAAVSKEKESKREEQSLMAKRAPAPASAPMKSTDPTGNESRDTRAAESDISRRRADDMPASGRAADPNKKQVSGKTFEFRQGAWYDTTYRGQGTITVRRHTSDYRKLDSGLRGIAESFFGTVVTIWNGRAYRIQ